MATSNGTNSKIDRNQTRGSIPRREAVRVSCPTPAGLWERLRAAHTTTGLWPLLLDGLDGPDDPRPWGDGELDEPTTSPESYQASDLLAGWWREATSTTDFPLPDDQLDHLHPYRSRWPGLAPAGRPRFRWTRPQPDKAADTVVHNLYGQGLRLGLVAAGRSADVPALTGWYGAGNHISDPGELSAVLRSWEDRFGARLVAIGFATLQISVATPPTKPRHALGLASELYALCPDLVEQGTGDLEGLAARLLGAHSWHIWWD